MSVVSEPAISLCFSVEIEAPGPPEVVPMPVSAGLAKAHGKYDLGLFTACSGIGAELTIEQREEGGNAGFVHQLPGRLKFSNVRLTRPLDADSARITEWFSRMATAPERARATISARRADGSVVATWVLVDVLPVKWTGPEMSTESAKACTETLEIAHQGFLTGA